MKTKLALVAVVAFIATCLTPAVANAAPAAASSADCNTTSWTWPVCDISWPSIPHFDVSGPRPDLTPKNSAWCRAQYISASSSGYTYWTLIKNVKYDLTWWPDYYARTYRAMYWDGNSWEWVIPYPDYPGVPMIQKVYCDA